MIVLSLGRPPRVRGPILHVLLCRVTSEGKQKKKKKKRALGSTVASPPLRFLSYVSGVYCLVRTRGSRVNAVGQGSTDGATWLRIPSSLGRGWPIGSVRSCRDAEQPCRQGFAADGSKDVAARGTNGPLSYARGNLRRWNISSRVNDS